MIKYYNSLSWRLGTLLKTREPDGVGKDPTLAIIATKSSWFFSLMLIFATFLSSSIVLAQTPSRYAFEVTSGTYTPITVGTGATVCPTAFVDDVNQNITGLPAFTVNGVSYTNYQMNSNGRLSLYTTTAPTVTGTYTPLSTAITNAAVVIAPLGVDLNTSTAATTNWYYQVIGNEIVFQWENVSRYNFSASNDVFNFQIRLNTSTNQIRYVYGDFTIGSNPVQFPQVGFRTSTTFATDVNNLYLNITGSPTSCTWANAVSGFSNTSSLYLSTTNATIKPNSGLTYTWTPQASPAPVRTFTAATGLTSSTGTVNWTAPTGATSYNVQYRIPGSCTWTNWSGNPVGTNSVTLTGLAPTTSYQVRVQAIDGSSQSIYSHIPNAAGTGDGYSGTGSFTTTATCPGVATALTASAITPTSATISWTAASPAPSNGYLYEVRTSGAAGSGATGLVLSSSTAAGVTTANLVDLTDNTSYNYYVRAFCGGTDYGVWTAASNFRTPCFPITTLPWNESFEDVTVGTTVVGTSTNLPPCWNSQSTNYSTSSDLTYNTARTGTKYLRYRWSTTNAFIWTPGFQLTEGVSYDFSFYGQGDGWTGWNNDIFVNTAVTPTGAVQLTPTYTATGPGSIAIQSYAKVTRTFVPSATGVYYFAIRGNQSSGSPWYMAFDDFSLDLTPTCLQPTGLDATFSSVSSADLSWVAPSPAPGVGYEWAFTTSATPPVSGTATTDLTASIGSLSPATTYYLHVRSVCVDGVDYSAWSTSSAFVPPVVTSVPWTEGFATAALPAQWSSSSFFVGVSTGAGGNPGNTIYTNLYGTVPTANFSSPNLGVIATNQLFSFDYRVANFSSPYNPPAVGSGSYQVQISTNYGATYTTLETVANDGVAGWRNKTYSLAAYAGQDVKIRVIGTWVSGDYYLAFDNFAVSALCEGTPDGGTVSVATQSVCATFPVAPISVSGASEGAGITYQWEESTNGGTSWANVTGGTGATTLTYQPPVYAGTVILYRLKVTCTNSLEENYSTTSEINGNPRPVPFTETFSDINNLAGWSTSGFSIGALRGATGNPGDNALTNLWINAPSAQLTTANFGPIVAGQAIMFDYKLSNYSDPFGPPATDSGSFEVFVSTNCGTSFTSLGVTTNNGVAGYQQKVYSLAPYVGQNVVVRIVGTWVSGDYDLSIDNLSIMVPPPSITSFDPISVCEDNEELVTITGEFFDGATDVSIGSTTTTFNFVDSNTITFTVPIGATSGTVSVTTPGGTATSAANLTVYPYPLNNPITGPDDKVCTNGTLQLTPGGAGSTWTSSNEAVATVDENGLVTGLSSGTTIISFSITDFGCTSTQDYTVNVLEEVSITTQPPSTKSIQTGTTSTISVEATGDGLAYQWYYYDFNDDEYYPVVTGPNFDGVDTDTLSIIDTPEEFDGYEFYCVVSGSAPCEDVTSGSTIISVGSTAIVTDLTSQSVCDSGSAIFTVETTGDVDTYTWYINSGSGFELVTSSTSGLTFSGEDTNSLTVSDITSANNLNTFFVLVDGPANSISSSFASLIVGSSVSITTQPEDSNVCNSGGSTSYSVAVAGSPSSIAWVYSTSEAGPFTAVANNTPAGATYDTTVPGTLGVTTTGSTPVNTYYYRAIVNAVAPCTNVESEVVSLTIDNPTITSQPTNGSVLRGSSRTFTVVTPTMGATIQWQRATAVGGPYTNVVDATPAGVTYTGADTATLTVITSAGAATGATNYYRAVVSAPATCSVNSTGALLTIVDYCTVSTTNTSDYTSAFSTTGGTTNLSYTASSQPAGSYSNQTAQNLTIYESEAFNFSHTFVGGSNGVRIWIDLNNNGVFDAAEQLYSLSSADLTKTGSVTIPAGTPAGNYRMRVRSQWNALPAACGNVGYGSTVDYTVVVLTRPACSGTPTSATVVASVANVCFSGTSILTASGYSSAETGLSFQWYNSSGPIASANAPTYTTPVLTSPETYYFRVTCSNSGLSADSNNVTIGVNEPEIVSTTPATRCGDGTVVLAAEGSTGTTVEWFAAASGGASLFSGESFTTPILTETTTFYTAASIGSTIASVGKASSAGADGNFIGNATGIVFSATSTVTLNSTVIYPIGSGTVTIALYNSAGTELQSTAAIAVSGTGASTPVTVPLNFTVSPGTGYRLLLKAYTGVTGLIRDFTGVTFPYNSTNASVTGGWLSGASTTYYFFYNLQVATGCTSARTAVTATITEAPAFALSSNAETICIGATSDLVTITEGASEYETFVWSPSIGVSGNVLSGYTFNPTETTTYTLTASDAEGCQAITSVVVTVSQLPVVFVNPSSPSVCSVGAPTTLNASTAPAYVTTGGCLTGSYGLFPAAAYTPANCNGTVYNIVTNAWAGEWSVVNVVAGNVYTFGSSIATDRTTISDVSGTTVLNSGVGNVVWAATFTGQVRFYTHLNDGTCGEQNTSRSRTISCLTNTDTYVWSPVEGLFTDAAGTIPYAGGATSTVYAKPAVDTEYTVTATSTSTCQNSTVVTVTVTPATTWYADADNDGFGNDEVTLQACTQPVGYAAVGGDCNDNDNTIYPGATEICYDGILQNCNGELTDGCPEVLTQMRPYFCGTTLQHVNSSILADVPTGLPVGASVTGYRYEITNLSTNDVREVEKTTFMVRISETDIAGFATAYSIRVAVRINSEWQAYGTTCEIITPSIPTTSVSTVCGQVLPSMQSAIYATTVTSSLGYEFEVSRMEGGIAVETTTIERSTNNFKITQLSGIQYVYASEYEVRVRVKADVNGVETWSAYGAVCSVFTPDAPEAAIEGCGGDDGIAPATLNTPIYATALAGATQYRFTLTDEFGYNQVYTTSTRFFRLSNFNALEGLTLGGQYFVTVEAEIYGYFYAGKDCNILVPEGTVIRPADVVKNDTNTNLQMEFKAIAYPNPFANSFAVDVKTSNTETISLTVYDMAGRLLEVKEVKASDVSNYQFGDRYPSGVYNMIVTQGEETRTVRVVKQ